MVHVGALPGTPASRETLRELVARAVAECAVCRDAGVHGVALENMHDVPYLRGGVGPEITAAMTVLALAVKEASGLPCGVQILAGANHEALAVAHAAGLDFVRVEGFAYAHVADEGIIESSAASLLRFRRQIGAERVQVWADVKKKHASHALTAVSIGEAAGAAEFMRADAVIVTGSSTGERPSRPDIDDVRGRCRLPLYLGSGITPENLPEYYACADGFIVGSALKVDGRWHGAVDPPAWSGSWRCTRSAADDTESGIQRHSGGGAESVRSRGYRLRYASVLSSQSWRGGLKMSTSSVSSSASALCGTFEGMWSTSPARTSTVSDSSSPIQNRSAPSTIQVSCSFSCECLGTTHPFLR